MVAPRANRLRSPFGGSPALPTLTVSADRRPTGRGPILDRHLGAETVGTYAFVSRFVEREGLRWDGNGLTYAWRAQSVLTGPGGDYAMTAGDTYTSGYWGGTELSPLASRPAGGGADDLALIRTHRSPDSSSRMTRERQANVT